MKDKKGFASRLSVAAVTVGGLIAYFFLAYYTGRGIPCIFHELTGLDCPGCGFSRMTFYLYRLDFYRALRMNPFMFAVFPFTVVFVAYSMYCYVVDKPNKLQQKIPKGVYYALAVICVLFGILRNIPAFSFLAPTYV